MKDETMIKQLMITTALIGSITACGISEPPNTANTIDVIPAPYTDVMVVGYTHVDVTDWNGGYEHGHEHWYDVHAVIDYNNNSVDLWFAGYDVVIDTLGYEGFDVNYSQISE